MKVFLTWSGEKSKQVAEIMREWLPNVIQALEPWISSEDIEKGSQWSTDIASRLKESKAGIICVTETNMSAPWLNFEAGAISNRIGPALVCTFLTGPKSSDLTGPLALFQATLPTQSDVRRLLGSLNKALEEKALHERKLDAAFGRWWPELEKNLESVKSVEKPIKQTRSERDILEETLNIVRDLQKHLSAAVALPAQASTFASLWPSGIVNGTLVPSGMVTVIPEGTQYATWTPAEDSAPPGSGVHLSEGSVRLWDPASTEIRKRASRPKLQP